MVLQPLAWHKSGEWAVFTLLPESHTYVVTVDDSGGEKQGKQFLTIEGVDM